MRFIIIAGLALATLPVFAQQSPPQADPQQSSAQQAQTQTQAAPEAGTQATAKDAESKSQNQSSDTGNNSGTSKSSESSDKKPGALGRLKRHVSDQMSSGCVNAMGTHCWDKTAKDDSGQSAGDTQAKNTPPPRSDTPAGESSSKSTKVDLSPPAGEAPPPGMMTSGDAAPSDVKEFKPWDPHKADKNVEIGDFYMKRGNCRAASSRYEEALYWKDNDAIAMFRLGQCQEKLGDYIGARKSYDGYLKILPDGEFSAEAKKALDRLKEKTDEPVNTAGKR